MPMLNVQKLDAQFAREAPAWAIPLPVGDDIPPLLRATGRCVLRPGFETPG